MSKKKDGRVRSGRKRKLDRPGRLALRPPESLLVALRASAEKAGEHPTVHALALLRSCLKD